MPELDSTEWFTERQRQLDEAIGELAPEQRERFDDQVLALAKILDRFGDVIREGAS